MKDPTHPPFAESPEHGNCQPPAFKAMKRYFRENPLVTLGIAVGLGIIVASGFIADDD